LTITGMENHLENGKFFRARYTDPAQQTYLGLDAQYKRSQVYVRSTDRDRTLMSAQSFLASLFPPNASVNGSLPTPLEAWRPIPVHTVPMETEPMLDGSPYSCPSWAKSIPKTISSNPYFISFMMNQTNITNEILNVSGLEYTSNMFNLFTEICYVYDVLFCEKAHDWKIKDEFVESGLFELTDPYAALEWQTYTKMYTDKEKALAGGVLLHELKKRVTHRVNETDDIKLVMFSGHDTTLAAILTCLGVYDGVQPPYATTLMLELWKRESGKYEVTLSQHNAGKELVAYQMPGCGETGCSLDQFSNLNTHLEITEDQYYKGCVDAWPDFIPGIPKNTLFLSLCLILLLFIASLTVSSIYIHRLRQRALPHAGDQLRALLESDNYYYQGD